MIDDTELCKDSMIVISNGYEVTQFGQLLSMLVKTTS